MGCNNAAGNIQIVPVKVYFGRYECQTVTASADVASSHNSDYFHLYSGGNATHYYVWMNVGGAGVDPAVGGATGIEVAFAANATGATIAQAIADAILALAASDADFDVSVSGAAVCICAMQPGVTTAASTGVGLTGFTYSVQVEGTLDDIGYTDGDLEVTTDEKLLDITAHQTGVDILTSLRQGKTSEIGITLKETDVANFKLVFGQAGTIWTPSGGTEVVSWGTSTNGANVIDKAGKLILHPYANSSSDYSEDLAFWKAHLKADSVTFSGENPMLIKCTFKCYTDDTRDTRADLFVYGDHTKNFKKP